MSDETCESCGHYRTVLNLCLDALPTPTRYGDLPGWIDQLVAVLVAARKLREIEKVRAVPTNFRLPQAVGCSLGDQWTAQDALDAALREVEK